MTELWLNFETENGEFKRVKVDRDEFFVGRHSESDLCIPIPSVSRQHIKINRFGHDFTVADLESSLGTKVNGNKLIEPISLKNGDVLELGETVRIVIELESDPEETPQEEEDAEESGKIPEAAGGGSIPRSFFYVVPILGLVILLCAGGGLIYMFSRDGGNSTAEKSSKTDSVSPDDDDGSTKRTGKTDKKTPETDSPEPGQSTPADSTPAGNSAVPTVDSTLPKFTEADKLRIYSAAFLSRIVSNDPDAFLLDRQIQLVAPAVAKLKSSSAAAANIGQAKKDADKIAAIAAEKGMQPDFLAAASVAKLGTNRGDVVATARTMAGILQKLRAVIGVESADEATVVVAAYYQGESGSFERMQSMLEGLTKGNNEGLSARQIRTIWFLNEKGKLKAEEFDLALRFIAIGTIMQKPDDFGVNP